MPLGDGEGRLGAAPECFLGGRELVLEAGEEHGSGSREGGRCQFGRERFGRERFVVGPCVNVGGRGRIPGCAGCAGCPECVQGAARS
ncbi:hypothetical protein HEK616_60640 [Streptomyces nigrescens]|uniref:Uncharacterized protein n=1 Tax=Streptomyces nigrescens TaxID=1920 RepID=A0ABN6R2E7_STRNI|nr:hypothetical protein HEK616_60640 [Streptomyces nigrescens]